MLAVLLGGALFGVIGALVAIPIAAAVQLIVGRWPSRAWTAPDGHLLSGPAWACEHRIMRYAMMSSGGVTFPKLVGHRGRASFAAISVASSSASPRPAASVPRPSG